MQNNKSISRWWLLLGCWSVAIAGLFSLVLVIARTPQLASMPLFTKLFHEALVVHVDLSVLVWFLAIACMLWSFVSRSRPIIPGLEGAALISCALGTALITLSPLDPGGEAMMSNYIPVIYSPLFFLGLALLFCGTALMLLHLFSTKQNSNTFEKPLQFGIYGAGIVTLVALFAFFWSYMQMPPEIDGTQYYELSFWGGGHVLQFTHTQMLIICWWLVMKAISPGFSPDHKLAYSLFIIAPAVALLTPFAYVLHDVTSQGHRLFFTHMMIAVGGIAPLVFMVLMLPPLWNARGERKGSKRALWSTLFMSAVLFIYGGVLGLMIQGQNVVIPAHYHGSIVGITLAFMGAAYLFLPQFGYRDVSGWKLAYWQPIVYGAGQIMHISGLAWSGGYGVLRKTPGVVTEIAPSVKIALGFMGLGGLLAIIGGLMFVIVAARSVFGKPSG